MNIVPKNECNFTNQIKLFAYKQLAQRWFKKMHENGEDCMTINDVGVGGTGVDDSDWVIYIYYYIINYNTTCIIFTADYTRDDQWIDGALLYQLLMYSCFIDIPFTHSPIDRE